MSFLASVKGSVKDALAPVKQRLARSNSRDGRRSLENIGGTIDTAEPSNAPAAPQPLSAQQSPTVPSEHPHTPTSASNPGPETNASVDERTHVKQTHEESAHSHELIPDAGEQELCADSEEGRLPAYAAFVESVLEVANAFSDPCPALKITTEALLVALRGFKSVNEVQDNFVYIAQKMKMMKMTYQKHRLRLELLDDMNACMISVEQTMRIVEKMISSKSKRSVMKRIWENPNDIEAVSRVLRILGDAVDQFVMNVTASTHSIVQLVLHNQVLDQLPLAKSAQFMAVKTARTCTEGTRTQLLSNVMIWATAASGVPPVFFLSGPAGAGKTTISYTICSILQGFKLLGGSFFCSRNADEKRRSADFIFSTLSRSLASRDSSYAEELLKVVQEDPGVGEFIAVEQFTKLIAAPIRRARPSDKTTSVHARILVIDALDECVDDPRAIHNLIYNLLVEAPGLHLRFLITSRPDPHIVRAFETANAAQCFSERIQDIPEDVSKGDIVTYLAAELKGCSRTHGLPQGWPPANEVQALASLAGTLFIYAATACKYISAFKGKPQDRLAKIIGLEVEVRRGVDPMYEFILEQNKKEQSQQEWEVTLKCIQAAVCLREPLSVQGLAHLLDMHTNDVRYALDLAQSVLKLPPSDDLEAITPYHASFSDYLTDKRRSGDKPWFLDTAKMSQALFRGCMKSMKCGLHFNVSNSRSSYFPNDQQPERSALSSGLRYACLHWVNHLESSGDSAGLELAEVSKLLRERFLYWLEVLSITGHVQTAGIAMTRLIKWIDSHQTSVASISHEPLRETSAEGTLTQAAFKLRQFTVDARNFVNGFHHPIQKSCPHIYLSALAVSSTTSMVREQFSSILRSLPRTITHERQHTCPLTIFRGNDGDPWSISFSPDGTRIVTGSSNRMVRLWDATTGEAIGEPLPGHDHAIYSVAFSPNGSRIVSGSADRTIRLWDTSGRIAIGEPLRGHEGVIWSVAISPDGTHIVSGSDDQTVRIWDVTTRAAVGEPLGGHEDAVWSVSFSPNGTHIVSGSRDKTLRVWDLTAPVVVGNSLRGHEDAVRSVAFSSDGTRIVSGSWDRTIRVWDTTSGETVFETLRGHEYGIWSVAFSPDGTRIVSGSWDKTIRLWDATTGVAIGEPLSGHEDAVLSVVFSSDGTRLASGSRDKTIRVWDATTVLAISELPSGHEYGIWSVAFSPDGTQIVSGSNDRTIRLWDGIIAAAIGEPLCGHENAIWSVAFSPDGLRIVSGSADRTIRVWDATTGAPIGRPMHGHKDGVRSVTFSPDGSRIASGSFDHTIRLWDPNTGAAVGEPLRGHQSAIYSVAFSPDGTRIVSGSWDKTIRLWDATTGVAIGEPLSGHEDAVWAVAFSPNGTRLASGSQDKTVRVWDATTGEAAGEPLRGHKDAVWSVSFSPNGTRIVSGSFDRTIRLWDANSGAAIGSPLSGHEDVVWSVAFSPDGARIVSGSQDRAIRLWNVDVYSSSTVDSAPVSQSNSATVPCVNHVAFSANPAHATCIDSMLLQDSQRGSRDAFTLDSEGWLRGPNNELFLWILPEYRRGLWWPRTTNVMNARLVTLDLSRFVHGEEWTNYLLPGDVVEQGEDAESSTAHGRRSSKETSERPDMSNEVS